MSLGRKVMTLVYSFSLGHGVVGRLLDCSSRGVSGRQMEQRQWGTSADTESLLSLSNTVSLF